MPMIEVSKAVYEELQRLAHPFEDTPDSVIARLLEGEAKTKTPARAAAQRRRAAVPPGSILPEEEYEVPILLALKEMGGAAPARVITDRVGEILHDKLTEADFDRHRSGDIRWRNRTAFSRLNLVRRGLLSKNSPRGIWEITDDGRAYLRLRQRRG